MIGRQLSEEEKAIIAVEYLSALRPRIENGELMPLEVFLGVIGVVPSVSMECVMLRRNPSTGHTEVLLTPREEDDPVWTGRPLHIPGTTIRPSDIKNGTFQSVFERVLKDEVPGIEPLSDPRFLAPALGDNGRSIGIGLIHLIEVGGSTENGDFFPTNSLPGNFLGFQREFVKIASDNYEAG